MVTRRLLCPLNNEEILERGQQLANAEHAYQALEEERKESNRALKENMDAVETRIAELALAIRDRQEMRDVECAIIPDHRSLKNLVVRQDTHETVETHDMTEAERQGSLL